MEGKNSNCLSASSYTLKVVSRKLTGWLAWMPGLCTHAHSTYIYSVPISVEIPRFPGYSHIRAGKTEKVAWYVDLVAARPTLHSSLIHRCNRERERKRKREKENTYLHNIHKSYTRTYVPYYMICASVHDKKQKFCRLFCFSFKKGNWTHFLFLKTSAVCPSVRPSACLS